MSTATPMAAIACTHAMRADVQMQAQPRDVGKSTPDESFLLLVTGGRDYAMRTAVFAALDTAHRKHANITIIHGACCKRDDPTKLTGADRWAQEWAQIRQRPYIGVPAEWIRLGDGAGPRRNGVMLCYLPHGVVAFPGGDGTADMCAKAEAAGVAVWRVG